MKNFRIGDEVLIEYDRQTEQGFVIHASTNGRSLMLAFDAIIDGHVGMMPVLRETDGRYHSIVTGTEVKLESIPERH